MDNLKYLVIQYLADQIDTEAFCTAYERAYADIADKNLNTAYKNLFEVVVWYSPFPDERARIPNYVDELAVRQAAESARKDLDRRNVSISGTSAAQLEIPVHDTKTTYDLEHTNALLLQAEERGNGDALAKLITGDFTIIRASGARQNRQEFLDAAPKAKDLGRTMGEFKVNMLGECALVQLKITTLRNTDRTMITRHFWNTRVFVQENGAWKCMLWQNTEIRS